MHLRPKSEDFDFIHFNNRYFSVLGFWGFGVLGSFGASKAKGHIVK